MLAACRRNGLALVAYCPLARAGELFAEPAVQAAMRAHDRTPAQVVLRWLIQQDGVGAIPRSSDPGRIAANLDVFDFALSEAEMAAITALSPRHLRICSDSLAPAWDPPGA